MVVWENAEISKALSIVEKSSFNDAQVYAYEQFWDAVYVEKALIEGGYNKGGEEGRAEERLANAKALFRQRHSIGSDCQEPPPNRL